MAGEADVALTGHTDRRQGEPWSPVDLSAITGRGHSSPDLAVGPTPPKEAEWGQYQNVFMKR